MKYYIFFLITCFFLINVNLCFAESIHLPKIVKKCALRTAPYFLSLKGINRTQKDPLKTNIYLAQSAVFNSVCNVLAEELGEAYIPGKYGRTIGLMLGVGIEVGLSHAHDRKYASIKKKDVLEQLMVNCGIALFTKLLSDQIEKKL